ncbi:MAG TPA: geranyl transferase [Syntrophomonas sp.]|jgi:geranylgeranyl diphosphate synthase type II|nr:geranyl transferase [Syntrophomonas sp.]HCF71790.1 geranyl transferase [Syntrophomonas sp.]
MAAAFDVQAFVKDLRTRKDYVDACLRKYMPAEIAYPPVIHQAMHYALFNGGKRLRPMLVLEGAQIAGGSTASVERTACALEFIHTYSLVHDDLPAMDDDDYRRGQLTCHKVFGEANAILTGDALLTAAFGLIADNAGVDDIEARNVALVIKLVAKAAGSQGMIGGQVLDLEAEHKSIDFEQLKVLQRLKTAELFRAALLAGAMLHNLPGPGVAALEQYAEKFGLVFQITDDILDVEGDFTVLGKPVGSDVRNDKNTYPSLFGLDTAKKMAQENAGACIEALNVFGPEADFLRGLAFYVVSRKS